MRSFADGLTMKSLAFGTVIAHRALDVVLPAHQSGHIVAHVAHEIVIPLHREGTVYSDLAEHVVIPSRSVGLLEGYTPRSATLTSPEGRAIATWGWGRTVH
jgi:hypothetical protein